MHTLIQSIHLNRLLLALFLTFLIADTYPHPHLSPGLLETALEQLQQRVISFRHR